jgi:hypothetical protein
LEHSDFDREEFLDMASRALGSAYAHDEVEYSEADLLK